jgi:glycosyltransferase involved in cell wall biosynthesis
VQLRRADHPSSPKRIGLYDTYLATLGGGENLLAAFTEVLENEFPEAEIDLITHELSDVSIEMLESRFGVALSRTRVRAVPTNEREHLSSINPLRRFLHEQDVSRLSSEYDLFVNNTIFSLAPPQSGRSIYMCMFPLTPEPWKLRNQRIRRRILSPYVAFRRKLYGRWIGSYSMIVAISKFTQHWIERLWHLDSEVLYPPIKTQPQISVHGRSKKILAIGRFFPGNHNKKHDVLIKAFQRLDRSGLNGWQLHLVGGRTDVPGTDSYISSLRNLARRESVFFHFDVSRDGLEQLLNSSSLFWHATGFGEDQEAEPEKLEHFGMSTLEAMTHGCVPLVYRCGGQPEIVENGVSGFLWDSVEELGDLTLNLACDPTKRNNVARAAHARSQLFSREKFRDRTRQILSRMFQQPELTDRGDSR